MAGARPTGSATAIGEGQQSHGEADGGGAIPCPGGSHRRGAITEIDLFHI